MMLSPWHCVIGWVVPDIPKECSAFIFRIQQFKTVWPCMLGTTCFTSEKTWVFSNSAVKNLPISHCRLIKNTYAVTSQKTVIMLITARGWLWQSISAFLMLFLMFEIEKNVNLHVSVKGKWQCGIQKFIMHYNNIAMRKVNVTTTGTIIEFAVTNARYRTKNGPLLYGVIW
jgi:hypothetical protein